jgi:hypothetical protein
MEPDQQPPLNDVRHAVPPKGCAEYSDRYNVQVFANLEPNRLSILGLNRFEQLPTLQARHFEARSDQPTIGTHPLGLEILGLPLQGRSQMLE